MLAKPCCGFPYPANLRLPGASLSVLHPSYICDSCYENARTQRVTTDTWWPGWDNQPLPPHALSPQP